MADNEQLAIWLRIRDLARFRRDARKAEEAIKEIAQAADKGEGPLNQLGGALGELASNLPQLTGRARIFGFAVSTVITALTAAIPLVVGLGGGLVALAGSFGGAAIGAGLLGTAVAGAAVPLGAFGLVVGQMLAGFKKVNTAWQAYNVAVSAFGKNSQQAETALQRLHGYIDNYGGPIIFRAVRRWSELQETFRKMNGPAIRVAMHILLDFLKLANDLMPLFAETAHNAGKALRNALVPAFAELRSGEFADLIRKLGESFATLSGPLVRSALNVLFGLLQIAARLSPLMEMLGRGIETVSVDFRNWATNGSLGLILNHLQEWWRLLKAVGGLVITIFSGGAQAGVGMVSSLTDIVNKWNEWLKGVEGQEALHSFFHDAAEMTKAFFGLVGHITAMIFKFGRALMPIYTVVFKALVSAGHDVMDALAPLGPFLDNILIPLLGGIAKGVLSGVVGGFKFAIFVIKIFSTVLGWIGEKLSFLKGPLNVVGQIIGFIFGPGILKLLGMLGKLHFLLGPLAAMFRLLAIPMRAAGALLGFLFRMAWRVISVFVNLASKAIPFVGRAFSSILNFIKGLGGKFFNAGAWIWNKLKDGILKVVGSGLGFAGDLAKAVANAVIGLLNDAIPNSLPVPFGPDINLPNDPIPMLASGGVVRGTGSWISGEAGPELNTMRGNRVQVTPLSPAVSAVSTSATLEPGGGNRTIVSKVYLRGRQIAEAVADEAEDEAARYGR